MEAAEAAAAAEEEAAMEEEDAARAAAHEAGLHDLDGSEAGGDEGGEADDDMLTPTGYPPTHTEADMAHSTQPALRPHRTTPMAEDQPPQTRRPHSNGLCSPLLEGPDPGSAQRHVNAGSPVQTGEETEAVEEAAGAEEEEEQLSVGEGVREVGAAEGVTDPDGPAEEEEEEEEEDLLHAATAAADAAPSPVEEEEVEEGAESAPVEVERGEGGKWVRKDAPMDAAVDESPQVIYTYVYRYIYI